VDRPAQLPRPFHLNALSRRRISGLTPAAKAKLARPPLRQTLPDPSLASHAKLVGSFGNAYICRPAPVWRLTCRVVPFGPYTRVTWVLTAPRAKVARSQNDP
jgi:hypothetical protein